MTRWCAWLVALAVSLGAAQAQSVDETRAYLSYLGTQGCVIGPQTPRDSVAAGYDPAFVAAKLQDLTPLGTVLSGGAVLLDAGLCRIMPPVAQNALALSDPDVQSTLFAQDGRTEACFLNRTTFMELMPGAKGWSELETARAYAALVSAGLVSGDLRFFSDDILATPLGVQWVTGRCRNGTEAARARASHDEIARWFDPFVRAVGPKTRCETGASFVNDGGFGRLSELTAGSHKNAWLAFEMFLIAHGGGWYSFQSADDRGTPRPPACGVAP